MSPLCSTAGSPLLLSGILRGILLDHFCDAQQILSKSLREFLTREGVWEPTPDASSGGGLYIETLHKWDPERTEERPALLIKEGDWEWMRVAIGDAQGGNFLTGERAYHGLWRGSHTLFALAGEGAEAQILAWEVAKLFRFFGAEIEENFDLHWFVVAGVGSVGSVKESREHYVVPVTVAYVMGESWWTMPEAPRLKRIRLRLSDIAP